MAQTSGSKYFVSYSVPSGGVSGGQLTHAVSAAVRLAGLAGRAVVARLAYAAVAVGTAVLLGLVVAEGHFRVVRGAFNGCGPAGCLARVAAEVAFGCLGDVVVLAGEESGAAGEHGVERVVLREGGLGGGRGGRSRGG